MPWIRAELERRGVLFESRRVTSLADEASRCDAVVNCTGLEARALAADPYLRGVRGDLCIAEPGAWGLSRAAADEATGHTYVIPRRGAVVIGGTSTETELFGVLEGDTAVAERLYADDIVVPGAPKLIVADEFDPVTGADIVSLSLGGAQSFNGGEPAATASLVPSTVKPRCAQGDLNCDGSVDANDLAIVLAAWGTNDPAADIDGSGVVDASDLSFILANWGGGAQ